jgi:hypothetical protein
MTHGCQSIIGSDELKGLSLQIRAPSLEMFPDTHPGDEFNLELVQFVLVLQESWNFGGYCRTDSFGDHSLGPQQQVAIVGIRQQRKLLYIICAPPSGLANVSRHVDSNFTKDPQGSRGSCCLTSDLEGPYIRAACPTIQLASLHLEELVRKIQQTLFQRVGLHIMLSCSLLFHGGTPA